MVLLQFNQALPVRMVYREIRDHEDLQDPLERGDFRVLPD